MTYKAKYNINDSQIELLKEHKEKIIEEVDEFFEFFKLSKYVVEISFYSSGIGLACYFANMPFRKLDRQYLSIIKKSNKCFITRAEHEISFKEARFHTVDSKHLLSEWLSATAYR